MAKSQHKTRLAILRSILGPVAGSEDRFAALMGRSRSWIKKASANQLQLSKDAAVRISYETGIAVDWLLGRGDADKPVTILDEPYSKEVYDVRRAELISGEGMVEVEALFSIYQSWKAIVGICADFKNAVSTNRGPLAAHRLMELEASMRKEFGHSDDKVRGSDESLQSALEMLEAVVDWIKEDDARGFMGRQAKGSPAITEKFIKSDRRNDAGKRMKSAPTPL